MNVNGPKFSGWTRRIDGGGSSYPSSALVNFIISCETVVSAELNEGTRLLNSELITDLLLTDQRVKFALNILHRKDGETSVFLLERVVRLFITVRVHAVARLLKRQFEKREKMSTKCSKGLRKTLKDLKTF